MKIHFLGTAAAEGFPNPFCRCQFCEKARKLGGKNIRSRTSVMIDDVLKVDYPPDTFFHALYYGLDLGAVRDLLFTHSHYDHYNPGDLYNRIEGFAHGIDAPLHIYGNDLVLKGIRQELPPSQVGERFVYHRVLPFQRVKTQTATITPLLADHDQLETCLLYLIEKDGKKILYGNDTGWFPDETWDFLQGQQVDLAILDCTGGYTGVKRSRNHMAIETILEVQKEFQDQAILSNTGTIVVTHFSHNSRLLHDDFVRAFQPYGIEVAYDGLVIHL